MSVYQFLLLFVGGNVPFWIRDREMNLIGGGNTFDFSITESMFSQAYLRERYSKYTVFSANIMDGVLIVHTAE